MVCDRHLFKQSPLEVIINITSVDCLFGCALKLSEVLGATKYLKYFDGSEIKTSKHPHLKRCGLISDIIQLYIVKWRTNILSLDYYLTNP